MKSPRCEILMRRSSRDLFSPGTTGGNSSARNRELVRGNCLVICRVLMPRKIHSRVRTVF